MKAPQLTLLLLMIFTLSAGISEADLVDFEAEPLNSSYGAAYFHSPNDLIFVEDGALAYITNYYTDGNVAFNLGRIKDSFSEPENFHNGHIMQLVNVGILFLFSGTGDSSFEYLHLGGKVNIEINAGGVMVADTFADLAGSPSPGLTISVTSTSVPGGQKGTVTIFGDVSRLQIGGQELFIDDVFGGGNFPGEECDIAVTHELLNLGQAWGGDFGDSPGQDMFIENGIKIFSQEFVYGSGENVFGECQVQMTPNSSFGFQRVMAMNKFSNFYFIDSLDIMTSSVSFEILSYGGVHNLKVNDGPLIVEDFAAMPTYVDSDVTMVVDTFPFSGGYRALVTLTGNIHELTVGGETLFFDNLCVTEASPLSAASGNQLITRLRVDGNFPNPFNPSTTIAFTTDLDAVVELSIVDLAGHRVAILVDEHLPAGNHEAVWNGRTAEGLAAPTGVYLAQLRSGQQVVSKKITMVK